MFALTAGAVVFGTAACAPVGSVESAAVNAWKATALPSDAGKILNRTPIVKDAAVGAGTYTLTMSCDGGGKEFFAVALDGKQLVEAGAACNGSRESATIKVPAAGKLSISASSVDAPLIFAYQLTPAA